jgi:putative tryptophan/tyrosine transport system substrate-binding protein
MKRRAFAAGALALALAPATGHTQSPRKRVGFLTPALESSPNTIAVVAAFLRGLAERGWVEGRDFEFLARYADNQNDRLPALARELVALAPDVILATINPAPIYLHEVTRTIPIVMGYGADPVLLGLAASHNRPGGNVTGIMGSLADGFMPKKLQFAHELMPRAVRIGLPFNVSNPAHVAPLRAAEEAALTLGLVPVPVEVRRPEDLPAAFAALKAGGAEMVVPVGDNLFAIYAEQISALATAAGWPYVGSIRSDVAAGAILGYGSNVLANFHRAAYFADRILKGTKPGDLPIEFPTTFDLVVNLRTAKAFGITIPDTIMILATEVIE